MSQRKVSRDNEVDDVIITLHHTVSYCHTSSVTLSLGVTMAHLIDHVMMSLQPRHLGPLLQTQRHVVLEPAGAGDLQLVRHPPPASLLRLLDLLDSKAPGLGGSRESDILRNIHELLNPAEELPGHVGREPDQTQHHRVVPAVVPPVHRLPSLTSENIKMKYLDVYLLCSL